MAKEPFETDKSETTKVPEEEEEVEGEAEVYALLKKRRLPLSLLHIMRQ